MDPSGTLTRSFFLTGEEVALLSKARVPVSNWEPTTAAAADGAVGIEELTTAAALCCAVDIEGPACLEGPW